jgi:hypothetical protein
MGESQQLHSTFERRPISGEALGCRREAERNELQEQCVAIVRLRRRTRKNLIRSVMYVETTHGWYEAALRLTGINRTILPMNIHASYWSGLGFSTAQLRNPHCAWRRDEREARSRNRARRCCGSRPCCRERDALDRASGEPARMLRAK